MIVGFLLGGRLESSKLREIGRPVLVLSISVAVSTVLFIGAGLSLLGVPVGVALILAGIGTATDPAATQDVASELRADGPFTRTLLAS